MSEEKKIHKPQAVTGFPEWLPEIRMVEQRWFDHIRRVFESYGFCSIETPSVEALDVLRAKGEVDKEIYVIERLHKDDGDAREARLALHFDQTVPMARYVAQHFNDLTFPFKRYQMQRVWRGERPQKGRFREFYQCDIDVINVDTLPLHFDAELPAIMWEILSALPGMENEKIQIRVSNRKILTGFLKALNIDKLETVSAIIGLLDKLQKLGKEKIFEEIKKLLENEAEKYGRKEDSAAFEIIKSSGMKLGDIENKLNNISNFIDIANHSTASSKELRENTRSIASFSSSEETDEGLEELAFVMDNLSHLPPGAVVADLSIVRGLDYYTGTVYETVFTENPGYGSICSGGRYDDLASGYINKNLPGVGMSIGFSRLFAYLLEKGKLPVGPSSPADILMVLPSEDRRALAAQTARTLRARGFRVEMYHRDAKIKNQIAYAAKKGIPYVWFPPFEDGRPHEVKAMASGEQSPADPEIWQKN